MAAATYININGHLTQAAATIIPHDNRAFRYGEGLFETMLFRDGHIDYADNHWQRLFAGMQQLGFNMPGLWNPGMLEQEVIRTVQKNRLENLCRIRLQVWNGSGGLYDTQENSAQFLVECFPLDVEVTHLNENGLVTGLATGVFKSTDALSGLKSCNAMIYTVAARQAKANRWNDAFVLNMHGRIAESTIANIFWVKNGAIFTPPRSEGCIAGIMRQQLIGGFFKQNFKITESVLTPETLREADEIFLTNVIRKIKWVRSFEDKYYTCDVVKQLCAQLKQSG